MGTRTVSNANPNLSYSVQYGFDRMWGGSGYQTLSEDSWIDTVTVYCGSYSGGNSNFTFIVWDATNGNVLGNSSGAASFGVGYGWNGDSLTSYLALASGRQIRCGFLATGHGSQTHQDGGHGDYYTKNQSSVGSLTGYAVSTQGFAGDLAWQFTYFPRCQIWSVPTTPEPVGATFQITGQSFSAGVTGVTLGGAAVTSYSVDSDGQMTLTVPAGATTGHVVVTSNAGGAITSAGTVQVGPAGWYKQGGTVHRFVGTWNKQGGVLVPFKQAYYKSGGTPDPTK